jgi:2-oxoglutarate dehydrogenase E1 component
MRRNYRTPLVVFTPKSLLRSPRATSTVDELANGRFEPLIPDKRALENPAAVKRVVFCSGKVYYDLLAEQEQRYRDDPVRVAIARIEEIYPWPEQQLKEAVSSFPEAECVCWAQEEPANMGAWTFVRELLRGALLPKQQLEYAGRRASSSTAGGSLRIHKAEQATLVKTAFDG